MGMIGMGEIGYNQDRRPTRYWARPIALTSITWIGGDDGYQDSTRSGPDAHGVRVHGEHATAGSSVGRVQPVSSGGPHRQQHSDDPRRARRPLLVAMVGRDARVGRDPGVYYREGIAVRALVIVSLLALMGALVAGCATTPKEAWIQDPQTGAFRYCA